MLGRDAGGDERRHGGAGAVDVVAPQRPNQEPSGSCSRSSQSIPRRAAGVLARVPRTASISTTCAVTSALGGSMTSPKSQNGSFADELAACCRRRTRPSRRRCTACRASTRPRARRPRRPTRGPAAAPAQREDHLGGVVDVGVVVVRELERPAARRAGGRRTAQSPRMRHLLVEQPAARRARAPGGRAPRPASRERDQRQRRVPDRRLAGLEPAAVPSSTIVKLSSPSRPVCDHRVVERDSRAGAAPSASRPTAAGCRPTSRRPPGASTIQRSAVAQRAPAQRRRAAAARSGAARGRAARTRPATHGERRDAARAAPASAARRAPKRQRGRIGRCADDDGERHDRLPRPAGEVVDVERDPRRQQDQLRRQRRHVVPRPEPEQRQPDAGEHARALEPAARRGRSSRARAHVLGVGRVAGQPQRDVGLDRRRQVAGAAVEVRPGAVVALLRADPAAADAAVCSSVRMPRNWRSSRSSASMVTLVSSSPFHQPSGSCRESRWSTARSSVAWTDVWAVAVKTLSRR